MLDFRNKSIFLKKKKKKNQFYQTVFFDVQVSWSYIRLNGSKPEKASSYRDRNNRKELLLHRESPEVRP